MSLRDSFELEKCLDDWEGVSRRCDLRAKDDRLPDVRTRISRYLREQYVAKTVLREALQRSMSEHNLHIRLEARLPQTERIRKMAFGEALCLLLTREKAGFWAPLDKLGGSSYPESTTPGIDVLAFCLVDDEGSDQTDSLYVFEVKTTSDRKYVHRSIVDPKRGILTFFNTKLACREMIQDEVNLVLRTVEKQHEHRHLIPLVLAFYAMPLEERRQREHYCPMFVLDAELEVEDHLLLLRDIKHPIHQKWLQLARITELNAVVTSTLLEAANL